MSRSSQRPPQGGRDATRVGSGRRRSSLIVALTFLVFSFAPGSDAQAAGSAMPMTFTADASLEAYPCFWEWPSNAWCEGGFDGTVSGEFAGDENGVWSVTLLEAPIRSTFAYVHVADCMHGTAGGALSVDAGDGDVAGEYRAEPGADAQAVTGLTLDASIYWPQKGTEVRPQLEDVVVTVDVAGLGTVEVIGDGYGAGAASFVPNLSAAHLAQCSTFLADDPPPADAAMDGVLAVVGG